MHPAHQAAYSTGRKPGTTRVLFFHNQGLMLSEMVLVGKGIKGFVARPGQQPQARAVSPSKRKQRALVKVVVGNKKMMAQEAIVVSQAVDDYMREMEVS